MLIYLDIDGVMLNANPWSRPEILEDGFPEFSKKSVNALNRLISNLRADIVLTTSHKHIYTLREWKSIFKRRNIKVNKLSRLPENTSHHNRKDELLEWFSINIIESEFIIIDDDKSLNGLPEYLKSRLIQTKPSIGLTEYLAEETIQKVKSSMFLTA